MFKDPIVEEVRKNRHEIEASCGSDSKNFYEYLIGLQSKYQERLIRRKPNLLIKSKAV